MKRLIRLGLWPTRVLVHVRGHARFAPPRTRLRSRASPRAEGRARALAQLQVALPDPRPRPRSSASDAEPSSSPVIGARQPATGLVRQGEAGSRVPSLTIGLYDGLAPPARRCSPRAQLARGQRPWCRVRQASPRTPGRTACTGQGRAGSPPALATRPGTVDDERTACVYGLVVVARDTGGDEDSRSHSRWRRAEPPTSPCLWT